MSTHSMLFVLFVELQVVGFVTLVGILLEVMDNS